jgi:hypothetical protein
MAKARKGKGVAPSQRQRSGRKRSSAGKFTKAQGKRKS